MERQGGRRREWIGSMRNVIVMAVSAAVVAVLACKSDTTSPSGGGSTNDGYTITIDSGISGQTATVGTPINVSIHVTKDSVNPAPGLTITWTVSQGNGKVSPATSVTDANGAASTVWTMGDTAGSNELVAFASGPNISVTVFATSIGGAAVKLSKVSPDSQAVVVGATTSLVVTAVDAFGNGAPNFPVTWTATGGSLSATTTTTGITGNAVVNFTTGTTPATYTVTANAGALGTASFKVVGF